MGMCYLKPSGYTLHHGRALCAVSRLIQTHTYRSSTHTCVLTTGPPLSHLFAFPGSATSFTLARGGRGDSVCGKRLRGFHSHAVYCKKERSIRVPEVKKGRSNQFSSHIGKPYAKSGINTVPKSKGHAKPGVGTKNMHEYRTARPSTATDTWQRYYPKKSAESIKTNTPKSRATDKTKASETQISSSGPELDQAPFTQIPNLRPEVSEALVNMHITHPTYIQRQSMSVLMEGSDALLAAETGSGKTLAYLIPLINRLRVEEVEYGVTARTNRPRAIVLLPSSELAIQVRTVLKSLSHTARLRVVGLYGGCNQKRVDKTLSSGAVDVLVTTPGLLQSRITSGQLYMSDVRYCVVDEADTLFDEGFRKLTERMITPIVRARNVDLQKTVTQMSFVGKQKEINRSNLPVAQIVVATATVTSPLMSTIAKILPKMKSISTPNVHKADPNVKHTFVRIRGHDESKKDALLAHLYGLTGSVVVFCNTYRSCDWLSGTLTSENIYHSKMHGCQDSKDRTESIDTFQKLSKGVLVCTDIASRGIDTRKVDKVIMFDFPTSVADYLHRAGRTGRLGTSGTVVSLYSTKDAILANRIETAVTTEKTLGGLFKDLNTSERPKRKRATSTHGVFQVDDGMHDTSDKHHLNPKDDVIGMALGDDSHLSNSKSKTMWL
eukprot:CFRG6176T1